MNNRGLIRYVFASSHTSQGFCTFIPELLNDIDKVYLLKGAPGTGKSTLIRMVGEILSEQGYDVEFWISALDSLTPDGVYFPQLKMAVVNGSLPESIDPRYPGVKEILINLGDYCDAESIAAQRKEIINLVDRIMLSRQKASKLLKEAVRVKADIRQLIAQSLNMEELDRLTQQLAADILEPQPGEKHYFASAFTAGGLVDYIHQLSQACQRRYIFKGPPGSGKSTIIGNIASRAKEQGLFLEYYHCGLEVDNLVMVIIRNMNTALIEAGYMELPVRPWDIVVDMSVCMDKVQAVTEMCSVNYRTMESLLYEARQQLEDSNKDNKELKKIYAAAMDFSRLDQIRLNIVSEANN